MQGPIEVATLIGARFSAAREVLADDPAAVFRDGAKTELFGTPNATRWAQAPGECVRTGPERMQRDELIDTRYVCPRAAADRTVGAVSFVPPGRSLSPIPVDALMNAAEVRGSAHDVAA